MLERERARERESESERERGDFFSPNNYQLPTSPQEGEGLGSHHARIFDWLDLVQVSCTSWCEFMSEAAMQSLADSIA